MAGGGPLQVGRLLEKKQAAALGRDPHPDRGAAAVIV
jgi:hypothetical protein